MDQITLTNLVGEGNSIRSIAKSLNIGASTVRYWLRKFDLSTRALPLVADSKKCSRCKQVKSRSDLYNRKTSGGQTSLCKICSCEQVVIRQRAFKQKCVTYLGGQCSVCGYSKCIGALEFHHSDPSVKDFTISKVKSHQFSKQITTELDKCILLCANYHREEHDKLSH